MNILIAVDIDTMIQTHTQANINSSPYNLIVFSEAMKDRGVKIDIEHFEQVTIVRFYKKGYNVRVSYDKQTQQYHIEQHQFSSGSNQTTDMYTQDPLEVVRVVVGLLPN